MHPLWRVMRAPVVPPILGVAFAALLGTPATASAGSAASGAIAGAADSTSTVDPAPESSMAGLEPIESMSLESLLKREIRGGEMGSYGLRLAEFSVEADLHGYLGVDLIGSAPGQISTFDLHHAVLFARADFFGRIIPELALEWEHAGTEFYMPYAQIDLKSTDALIFRVGYFVTPVGAFNEYQYPDFLRKTILAPIAMREIIPALWSEVGVQVRGKVVDASGRGVNYAVFTSNGLEQTDSDPSDDVVPEGGSIRGMTKHARDQTNADKAFGGRLGATLAKGLDLGCSGYHGAYTADGRRDLTMLGTDLALHFEQFTLRMEAVAARQEVTGGRLNKRGGYVLLARRANPSIEPYVQLESVHIEGLADPVRRRLISGIVFYPFPGQAENVMMKIEGAWTRLGDGNAFGQLLAQLTLGF